MKVFFGFIVYKCCEKKHWPGGDVADGDVAGSPGDVAGGDVARGVDGGMRRCVGTLDVLGVASLTASFTASLIPSCMASFTAAFTASLMVPSSFQ